MPTFAYPEAASIITRTVTGTDSDGNDVYGTTTTATTGAFAPAGSTEQVQGQDTVIDKDTFYLSDGATTPKATDRLVVRGVTYEIDGQPAVYSNPFTGVTPGAVLRLNRVTG